MKRDLTSLQIEWQDTLHRIHKMLGRVVKSAALIDAAEKPAQDAPGPTISGSDGPGLTGAAQAAQDRILARRRRIFAPPEEKS